MPGLHHLRPDEKRWSSLRWVELLDKAARSPDQESIMHAAEYAVCHEARASEAVEAWKRRAGLCEAQGEPAVGLSLLYIANDVLQRFRDSHSLLQAFTDKLPELVWRLYACAKRERSAQTAQSILSLVCSTHPSMLTPGLLRSCPPCAHLQSVELTAPLRRHLPQLALWSDRAVFSSVFCDSMRDSCLRWGPPCDVSARGPATQPPSRSPDNAARPDSSASAPSHTSAVSGGGTAAHAAARRRAVVPESIAPRRAAPAPAPRDRSASPEVRPRRALPSDPRGAWQAAPAPPEPEEADDDVPLGNEPRSMELEPFGSASPRSEESDEPQPPPFEPDSAEACKVVHRQGALRHAASSSPAARGRSPPPLARGSAKAEGGGGPVPVCGEGGLGGAPLPHEPPLKRARVAIPLPSVPREERRPAAPGAAGAGAGVGLGLFALPSRDVSEADVHEALRELLRRACLHARPARPPGAPLSVPSESRSSF